MAELDWTKFINQPNPVASALMARMKFHRADRPRVKLQCLRLLATLRLNPEKSALIWHFVESYLSLNEKEVRIFKQLWNYSQEKKAGVHALQKQLYRGGH